MGWLMFRFSVAAFYAWLAFTFYRPPGRGWWAGFILFCWLLRVHSEIEKIVHRMPEILFAAKITFRCLNRCVSQQKLNLLNLATSVVAQLRTSSAQVVWCNVVQTCLATATPDHIPHNVLREATPPYLPFAGNRSEDLAVGDVGSACPLVERGFDPVRNRHGADVATFANQINHGPVPLSHLNFVQIQSHEFRSAETAAEQHGQHGVVTLGSHRVTTRMFQNFRTLLHAQPITGTEPELLHAFHSTDARRQLGTQQARIGGFMS